MNRLLLLVVSTAPGCAWVINVDGGAAVAMDLSPPPVGVPSAAPEGFIAMHTAAGFKDFGLGLSARSRIAARGFEVGAGPEVCWMPALGRVNPYACAGASLLSLGYRDDAFSLGAMSPYIQPAVAINVGESSVNSIFVSAPVGIDVRVTDQPSSAFFGLAVGVGWSLNTGQLD